MKILAIETSCDETAISVVEGRGGITKPKFKVRSHLVASQATVHERFGGVVPSLAKREHAKNLVPLLLQALSASELSQISTRAPKSHLTVGLAGDLRELLAREGELLESFLQFIPTVSRPALDAIAVTQGPGLEPALWVGLNFAKALARVWDLPLVPVNHLEGHIASVLVGQAAAPVNFPLLALIASGGHTELVAAQEWGRYELIGRTRDDAVGEAFDKVARVLGLGYPGGPAIAQLAGHGTLEPDYALPRPMINSGDDDFSFSGLKTAVLYLVKKIGPLSNLERANIARQFQQAVIDVLITKTLAAINKRRPRTLVVGGGVSANDELRRQFTTALQKLHPEVVLRLPPAELTGDNATMIAAAAYLRLNQGRPPAVNYSDLAAAGDLRLE